MPFRFATLAFALAAVAAASAASAQTATDTDRTTVEADVIEGVGDIEVTARGSAEITRDDMSPGISSLRRSSG